MLGVLLLDENVSILHWTQLRLIRYMWHKGLKPIICRFWLLYSVIFYTASVSKYFQQNRNILFLTEVILIWFSYHHNPL